MKVKDSLQIEDKRSLRKLVPTVFPDYAYTVARKIVSADARLFNVLFGPGTKIVTASIWAFKRIGN